MKRKYLAVCFVFILSGGITSPAAAAGVPTVSVPELSQLIQNAQQQAKQALAQLEKAKEAIQQAKSQYEHYKSVTEGNDKLGAFISDGMIIKLACRPHFTVKMCAVLRVRGGRWPVSGAGT